MIQNVKLMPRQSLSRLAVCKNSYLFSYKYGCGRMEGHMGQEQRLQNQKQRRACHKGGDGKDKL